MSLTFSIVVKDTFKYAENILESLHWIKILFIFPLFFHGAESTKIKYLCGLTHAKIHRAISTTKYPQHQVQGCATGYTDWLQWFWYHKNVMPYSYKGTIYPSQFFTMQMQELVFQAYILNFLELERILFKIMISDSNYKADWIRFC